MASVPAGVAPLAVPIRIVRKPLPGDDPRQRQPDIARARTLLGWEPSVPLRQGLERTVAYFRELLAEEMPVAGEKLKVVLNAR